MRKLGIWMIGLLLVGLTAGLALPALADSQAPNAEEAVPSTSASLPTGGPSDQQSCEIA
jgi:hypothetical protein